MLFSRKYLLTIMPFLALVSSFVAAQVDTQEATSEGDSGWSNDFGEDWGDSWDAADESAVWNLSGFIDAGYGEFENNNLVDSAQSLSELRGQFSANRYYNNMFFTTKLELLADDVDESVTLEARELLLDVPLGDQWNLKAGQQVLTWGTGDFLFLNDYFPKDWQAMFSGRDDEYLKAPSASLKLGYFSSDIGIDFVITPEFTSDNYLTGERFSFYRPGQGVVAAPPKVRVDEPSATLNNAQYYSRVYKRINGVEYAAYFYRGFYNQPLGYSPSLNKNIFPRMNNIGFSFRTPWKGGIANMEWAYQNSVDDPNGDDPLIPNGQIQWLTGFERELVRNLTFAGQALLVWTQDYDQQQETSPNPELNQDELHKLLTVRLTHMAYQQKLTSSLFVFYSPDANDFYLKPKITWRQNDHWSFVLGANVFGGDDEYTQWGQFKENNNLYARVKFSF